jgi:ferredoxin-NADP reductase
LINEKLIEEYSRLTFESKLLKDGSIEIKLDNSKKIIFFVQPQDSKLSVIRGVLNQTLTGDERYNFLKNHNFICERLRSKIDAITHELMIEPMVAKISQVSEDLAKMPLSEEGGRKSDIKVVVSEKRLVSEGVVSLKLEGIRAQLPTFQPGAHIDLHLQNGLIRQYSLLNGPGETDCYRIGVKLEDVSTGGSEFIHKNIREGDLLAISMPRNNFPLRRDSIHTVFIAGGIGLTPLLSMSQVLHGMGLNYELHYFVRDEKHVSFNEVLKKLGKNVSIHAGLSPESTLEKISEIVQNPMKAKNLYACGPGPMLEATLKIASDLGWSDDSVHFEYFKNTKEINDKSSFEIELARSALSLNVPSGKTVLEVLKSNGIDLPSSCEQGACGTCKVNVIEGEVDHQDVYLNSSEKAEGKVMMTCVSRAISKRLILDI